MSYSNTSLSGSEKDEIRKVCRERGIDHLVHFTRIRNFPLILQKGLVPRTDLGSGDVDFNDMYRQDGYPEAISLSVQFPNYLMFYNYRQNSNADWVVLILDKSIIWDLDCAFYYDNAASSKFEDGIAPSLKNVESFREMFDDVKYKDVPVNRSGLDIPDSYTTNPQAEILSFSKIGVSRIEKVACNSFSVKNEVQEKVDKNSLDLGVEYNSDLFGPRTDYEVWKAISNSKKGDTEAKRKLGNYYLHGDKVDKDEARAAELFQSAAHNDDVIGSAQLAYCYAEGKGVEKDPERAFELWKESAKEGYATVQHNVGHCFENGFGTEQDHDQAKTWYRKAADQGHQAAEEKLKDLQEDDDSNLPF